MKQEMKNIEGFLSTARSSLETGETDRQELKNITADLNKQLQQSKAKNDQFEVDALSLNSKITILSEENAHFKACVNESESKLRKASVELEAATSSLESTREDNIALANNLISLQDQKAIVAKQHAEQMENVHGQIIDLTNERDNCKYDIGKCKSELDIITAELKSLKKELEQTNGLLRDCKTDLAEARHFNSNLQADIDKLNAHKKGLEDDLRQSDEKVENYHKK